MNELFKKKGIKNTKGRILIFEYIKNNPECTLKQIINKFEEEIDESTIYRIINLFISKEIIKKKVTFDNNTKYIIHEGHKHYISCIKCHKKKEINYCPLKEEVNNEGFDIIFHEIELEGICNDCKKLDK